MEGGCGSDGGATPRATVTRELSCGRVDEVARPWLRAQNETTSTFVTSRTRVSNLALLARPSILTSACDER
jgi:hypothetical protein